MRSTEIGSAAFSRDAPIGIFDSGVGGLSVLREVAEQMPGESVIYFADTAHVPYGGRPLDEVRNFALDICGFLAARGAKMIVMACNISSAVAVDEARERHLGLDILGVIEPGAAAAVGSGAERIGVIATAGTVRSGAYSRCISVLNPAAVATEVACPAFVPLVEAGETEGPEAMRAAREYLTPLADAGCETIIHGCTHYPFLQPTLSKVAASLFPQDRSPSFLDPARETVRLARQLLRRHDSASPLPQVSCQFFVSGDPAHFERQGSLFLG